MKKFDRDFGFFDSENLYPRSVVNYTKFGTFELRQIFAYLRQKELVLQKEIRDEAKGQEDAFKWSIDSLAQYGPRAVLKKARLLEVEAVLIFVATNFPEINSPSDQEKLYPMRVRRGEVPGIKQIEEKFRNLYRAGKRPKKEVAR